MNFAVETQGWAGANVDHNVYHSTALQEWLQQKWANGIKIRCISCMDNSEYGMHFHYRFEDPEQATEFKLKFQCI